ncbi:DUF2167 domain-containing protein [Deinococcus humi]|uniref:Putative membrane-anchored protein n=1 Tax=Deinococcus humi TaxID=662880 RepID=A0A7W8JS75_9DEIO|nr:DUF2167 domain-containing protein [Deinococcus humi]MBB5361023.1 putative membrane-anchored protein [Deinococcus humi]GGO18095.1 hypothetical protein GCM10008949_00920 [Deinococcus humi]
MKLHSALPLGLLLLLGHTVAATPSPDALLHYRSGVVPLLNGKVSLDTGSDLRFLDRTDAGRVIVDLWGNPPGSAEDVVGMIVPAGLDPDTQEGWGVVITESLDGHVTDKDAARTNYDRIMHDLQRDTAAANAEREQAGYGTVDLIGWADAPHYEAGTHKMYWAKELAFHGPDETAEGGEHTLNYAVRVLGRDSVLELNAVAGMDQLPQVKGDMQRVLQQVSFTSGHRYEDYTEGTDRLATYGVAGLLGVAAAKKVGLLAGGLLLLKKGGVLLLGAFAALGRLFRRRSA